MGRLRFTKMHGLGNDFVVVDGRGGAAHLSAHAMRTLADRHTGIGCDQVITLGPSAHAHATMAIHNADGSQAEACGNAARCVGALLIAEAGGGEVAIDTPAGVIRACDEGAGRIAVDMGEARFDWRAIPLSEPCDTLHLAIEAGPLRDPAAVSMGNPHAVFFVPDAEAVDLARWGPELEHHPFFPRRTNVEVATVRAPGEVRLRVWERGAGITRACGTGACATVVAAVRRGLGPRRAKVALDGGTLAIEWRDDGHVVMAGPAAVTFCGETAPGLLA